MHAFGPHPIRRLAAGLALLALSLALAPTGLASSSTVISPPAQGAGGWGINSSGQVGDGSRTDRLTPVRVQGLGGLIALSGGGQHSLAVKSDGTAWAWGLNQYGQLGDGTT